MKAGFEDRKKLAIFSVLLLVMLGAVVYFVKSVFVGGGPPPTAATSPSAEAPQSVSVAAQQRSTRSGSQGHAAQKVPGLASLDPTLHPELMAGAESLDYTGSGRNIFSMNSAPPEIEKVHGPVRPTEVVQNVPTGPPPPPPIDLKFFGYEAEGGARKAFLLHGDDVFIASEGDVVDHHYKVVKINPLSIQVTDLLYNNTQTLPLTQS